MKKIFYIILSVILLAVMLCSCGANSSKTTSVTSGGSQTAAGSSENAAEISAVSEGASVDDQSAAVSGDMDGDVERTGLDIIEEMTVYYGSYGDEAEQKIDELLSELKALDPEEGEKWEKIMDLWDEILNDTHVNENELPDGLPDTDELAIVVLGFKLLDDGTMQKELIERLTVALKSAEKYPNCYIICTGGGTAAKAPAETEAGQMAEWLIEQGMDEDRVIVEDTSITTAQNAINSLKILREKYPQVKRIAIVSSDYHIATGKILFAAEGILNSDEDGNPQVEVISDASWVAPTGYLSPMFQAGALIELAGDVVTAFSIYHDTYDIHELPDLE